MSALLNLLNIPFKAIIFNQILFQTFKRGYEMNILLPSLGYLMFYRSYFMKLSNLGMNLSQLLITQCENKAQGLERPCPCTIGTSVLKMVHLSTFSWDPSALHEYWVNISDLVNCFSFV